jgi:hypothetical protein
MRRLLFSIGALSTALIFGNAALAQQGSSQIAIEAKPTAPLLAQASPPQGAPTVQPGWDCSGCALGATYCVINLVRFEHVCAPLTTYACAGFSGTASCSFGTICWDGNCHSLNFRW